jgi:membrane fusion protein
VSDSQENEPLFRSEVQSQLDINWMGDVIFAKPLSFKIVAYFSIGIIIAILLLGYFGTYTKKHTVVGQLLPESGVVKVYSPQPGVVSEVRITEGQSVKKGDALFVISTDTSNQSGGVQATISQNIKARVNLLTSEMRMTQEEQGHDRKGLLDKIAQYKNELSTIDQMVKLQKGRVSLSNDIATRYRQLLVSQFVSEADVQNREAELLEEQSKLASLERERISTRRDLEDAQVALQDFDPKSKAAISAIQREFHSTQEDLTQSEGKRQLVIVAPQDGIATAILPQLGQEISGKESLASILPKTGKMHAVLYVSSKAIGFVAVGAPVDLRYEAYPYQQYGTFSGEVIAVSKNALTPSEFTGIGDLLEQRRDTDEKGAPLYPVTVKLDTQYVMVNGKPKKFAAGMLLEADVIEETRRLYQWAFEPLKALDLPEFNE